MPAARFFVMLEAKRVLDAEEAVRACWASRCAAATNEGFAHILDFFQSHGRDFERIEGRGDTKPPPVDTLDPSSLEAKERVLAMFRVANPYNRSVH